MLIEENHWLQIEAGIRHCASPNFNDRPDGVSLSLIVVHNISLPPGQFGGGQVEAFFTNCLDCDEHPYFREIATLQVSAHAYIRRDGEIIQLVPFHKRAWHAGQSHYAGCDNCNDFSVGIELEGTDDLPYEPVQYQRLAALCRTLVARYPELNVDAITGHSDIAPGRKTDPGPCFDWARLHQSLVESD